MNSELHRNICAFYPKVDPTNDVDFDETPDVVKESEKLKDAIEKLERGWLAAEQRDRKLTEVNAFKLSELRLQNLFCLHAEHLHCTFSLFCVFLYCICE